MAHAADGFRGIPRARLEAWLVALCRSEPPRECRAYAQWLASRIEAYYGEPPYTVFGQASDRRTQSVRRLCYGIYSMTKVDDSHGAIGHIASVFVRHPNHVGIAMKKFRESDTEVAEARRLIAAILPASDRDRHAEEHLSA